MPPPGAPSLRPEAELSGRTPFSPTVFSMAQHRSRDEHCDLLASRGFCQMDRGMMHRFCPGACNRAPLLSQSELEDHKQWSRLSLFDYRQYDPSQCLTAAHLPDASRRSARCADLEDLSRIKDRGWAIRRGFVPPAELSLMAAHVASIPQPARSMCGASGYQPKACFLPTGWNDMFPRFFQALQAMLEGWMSSGFHDEASLGFPLHARGGEFVTISPWRKPQTATCIFYALFATASARTDGKRDHCVATRCAETSAMPRGSPDADLCRMRCEWFAVTRMPHPIIRRAVTSPDCNSPAARSLSWLRRWSFSEAGNDVSEGERWGAPDAVEMHGWLRLALNDSSIFSGFHGWHQDGPADTGRFHKVFVMVEKNRSTARRMGPDSALTNLMAVNTGLRYQHNCQLTDTDEWDREAFDCRPHLLPGDILFFREDVWHSTQDALLDRVSLIIDVFRVPLRTTPSVFVEKGSQAVASDRANEMDEIGKELHQGDDQFFQGAQPRDGRQLGERVLNRQRRQMRRLRL